MSYCLYVVSSVVVRPSRLFHVEHLFFFLSCGGCYYELWVDGVLGLATGFNPDDVSRGTFLG